MTERMTGPIREINITGCVMPAHEDRQPILLSLGGSDDLFIPVFSSVDRLRMFMTEFDIDFDRIKVIMDGSDFIQSVEEDQQRNPRSYAIRIALDPYRHENGNPRWIEILGDTN